MAKKLKSVEEEAPGTNYFEVFDPAAIVADVDNLIALADDAKEGAQPVKDEKARLKAERGYNMKGLGVVQMMRRADRQEGVDVLRTIIAGAEGMGLIERGSIKMVPDLVDLMDEAA